MWLYQTFLEFQLLKVIPFFFFSQFMSRMGWTLLTEVLREQADKDSTLCCYCLCVQCPCASMISASGKENARVQSWQLRT